MLTVRSKFLAASVFVGLVTASLPAVAAVNLELRPTTQNVFAGQRFVNIGLYAVANPAEPLGVVLAVLQWDPTRLTLIGNDDTGAPNWASSGFFGPGLNADLTDGDATYSATVMFPCNTLVSATPGGVLLTTLQFSASSLQGSTPVVILATLGGENTTVFDNLLVPGCDGVDVTGTLGPAVNVAVSACSVATECADSDPCTDDLCTSGVCSNPLTFVPGVDCCNPTDGTLTTISDGNDCTSDFCDSSNGTVLHSNEVLGVPCGDQTQTTCDNPDICDGMGTCLSNFANDGIFCNAEHGCRVNGNCMSGLCVGGNNQPVGTVCDDGLNCTQNDACNILGLCDGTNPCTGNTPFCFEDGLPPGFVCGDCIDNTNCPPSVGCVTSSCNMIGHLCGTISDDAACNDGSFCNGGETCETATGNCLLGAGNPCGAGTICDETNDVCVECLNSSDCDQSDKCNPQACSGGMCVTNPVVCTQDLFNHPCEARICDPATGSCIFVAPETVSCAQQPCPCDDPLMQNCPFQCDPASDTCVGIEMCSDNTGCTAFDRCINGACVGDPPPDTGNIDMILSPVQATYSVGQTVFIDLNFALNNTTLTEVDIVEVALSWDPKILGPPVNSMDPCDGGAAANGCICPGQVITNPGGDPPLCEREYDWFTSGLLSNFDRDNLNASFLDGDAHYEAFIEPGANMPGGSGAPVVGFAEPLKVTTLSFIAFGATTAAGTQVSLDRCTGLLGTHTRVLGGPGILDISGNLVGATFFVNCTADSQCDDGNPCTVGTCLPNANPTLRFCQQSPVGNGVQCGNQTPTDDCDQPDICVAGACLVNSKPNGTACNDGLFCTLNEVCQNAVCTAGQPNPCSEQPADILCTVDTCNENLAVCEHGPSNGLCNNGQFCDGVETCDPVLDCLAGTPPDCTSDGIACTENDFCNEVEDRCDGVPNNALCVSPDVCVSGVGCVTAVGPPTAFTGYPHGVRKNRFVSFVPDPNGLGVPHGYRVTHVGTGQSWFISSPRLTPVAGLGITFLVSDPIPPMADFSVEPVIHVGGCLIAPGETYQVSATMDGISFTAPLTVTTAPLPTNGRWWADVIGSFAVSGDATTTPPTPMNSWTPPDGIMNGFDVTATLRGFQNVDAPDQTWVDLNAEIPDRIINGNDVLRSVNAFSVGTSREFYPFNVPNSPGPQGQGACPVPPLEASIAP